MPLILYCEIYKYTVKHTLSKATSVALLTVTNGLPLPFHISQETTCVTPECTLISGCLITATNVNVGS